MSAPAVTALKDATALDEPFPHVVIDRWLNQDQAQALLDWFETEADWRSQERSFYTQHSCWNVEALRAGPLAFLLEETTVKGLVDQLGATFDVDLDTTHVHVEAHRLLPGEGIGLHNDNPILGTEALRIVAHFTRGHEDRYGGHLVLFASENPADIAKVIRPLHNTAVSFPLGPRSFHAVTDVRDGVRYSLVLGFFERGRVPVMHQLHIEEDGTEQARLAEEVEELPAILQTLRAWGAAERPHGNGTLLEHLSATAGLLARWRAPRHVCLAGLVHSVYGTQSIEDPLLTDDDRARVVELVGAQAEALVWNYCRTRFGDVYREPDATGYRAQSRAGGPDVELSLDDVVALNIMAWANQLSGGATVEISHDSWFALAEVVDKLEAMLPEGCASDMRAAIGGRAS